MCILKTIYTQCPTNHFPTYHVFQSTTLISIFYGSISTYIARCKFTYPHIEGNWFGILYCKPRITYSKLPSSNWIWTFVGVPVDMHVAFLSHFDAKNWPNVFGMWQWPFLVLPKLWTLHESNFHAYDMKQKLKDHVLLCKGLNLTPKTPLRWSILSIPRIKGVL